MSANSKIEWCDHTFNPWEGCQKVGLGCDNCYAETRNARFGGGQAVNWGPGAPRRRTSISNWELPKRWYAQAEAFMNQHGRRQRVFCASLADVFDNQVPEAWRIDLFALIEETPHLDWLLLTKRIGNATAMVPWSACSGPWDNVWIGATICNQAEADRDIPKLLAVPARVRFLSMEPLLGPVDIDTPSRLPCPNATHVVMDPETGAHECCRSCDYTGLSDNWGIDWVIVGGESGPGARPMHPDWVRSLRDQCQAAGVPFLFKQWGEWADMGNSSIGASGPVTNLTGDVKDWMQQAVIFNDGRKATMQAHSWTGHATDLMYRIGKKAAGRLLDGRTWNEYPKTTS